MDVATADVITTAVAPVVMVSAAGLLFIGVQTKNLSLADRVRDLARELRTLPASDATGRRENIRAQLALFERRLRVSQHALESLYVAIFCFVATTLLLAAMPWLGRGAVALPAAAVVFTLGIAFVLLAIVLEFFEMRAGGATIALELRSLK